MEQTLTSVLSHARSALSVQSPSTFSRIEQKANNLVQAFPTIMQFGKEYTPQRQVDYAVDVRKTIMGDHSTLMVLDKAYGDNSAASWIAAHLADLNTFCGSKNMDNEQTKALALILAREYKNVKFSILMLFFYKFKCGYFGRFWGKVDPMVITVALKDFVEECEKLRQEYLNEDYAVELLRRDALMELRHKAESQWWRCQEILSSYCREHSLDDVFSRMTFLAYDMDNNALTFRISREDYELLENEYLSWFYGVITKHFPSVKIQYQLVSSPVVVPLVDEEKKAEMLRKEKETALYNARRILSNAYGLDEDGLQQMITAFRLRYHYDPEEYLKLFNNR